MILIDYSQVALGNIYNFSNDLAVNRKADSDPTNILRHCILSTLKSYKKKYGKEYGELVICCDGRNYWRKSVFPHYKANRKKKREASDLDWKAIFDAMSTIRDELIENFRYKVINIDECEGDDIIAILAKNTENFGNHEPVLIISSDGDFKQLHQIGSHVKQWSPIMKKYLKYTEKEIEEYIVEHIVKGDSGDGIPNIVSPDDIFVSEGRQGKITAKRLHEFFEKGRDACRTDLEKIRWDRNRRLVNFDEIPDYIAERILNSYNTYVVKGSKNKIFNYLVDKKCKLLLSEIEEF